MKKIIENYYDYLFAILLIILPFSSAIPSIILCILIVFFIIDVRKINFKPLKTFPFYMLYALFGYMFLKAVFTGAIFTDINLYSRYIFILVIPILFLKLQHIEKIKIVIIASVSALIIKSLFLIIKFYIVYHTFPLADGSIANALLTLERPYAGFMALMSIILSLEQIQERKGKNKIIFILSGILAFSFIMLISARNSFLTLLLLFILYLFFYLKISNLKKLVFIIGFSVVIIIAVGLNKNFTARFHIKENLRQTLTELAIYEPRYIIWPCAYNLTGEKDFNFFLGFKSEQEITQKLTDCYGVSIVNNESRKNYFLESKFNTHNQFISLFLSAGILGLILILSFFSFAIYSVKNNFFAVAVFVAIIFFFLFENVFFRQFGCYIFSIFTTLFLLKRNHLD